MGNASLEAKLLQQLMAMRGAFLYKIFLDLQKSYNFLDQDRCLVILAAYGVVPRMLQILQTYWGHLTTVSRYGSYYAPPPPPLRDTTVLPRETPCPPRYLTWLWTPSSATG